MRLEGKQAIEEVIFYGAYNGKRLFADSISRTLDGYHLVKSGKIEAGLFHILLARVESAAACAFVAISSMLGGFVSLISIPLFLIPMIPLNLVSRLPGISSFKAAQNFTQFSNNAITGTFKAHLIAVPAILLFLTAASINTFLPGTLKIQNIFSDSIDRMVAPFGELRTIKATVPGTEGSFIGTEGNPSPLERMEENLRALSTRNYIQEHVTSHLEYTYTVYR